MGSRDGGTRRIRTTRLAPMQPECVGYMYQNNDARDLLRLPGLASAGFRGGMSRPWDCRRKIDDDLPTRHFPRFGRRAHTDYSRLPCKVAFLAATEPH
jgi:hypothetical protein